MFQLKQKLEYLQKNIVTLFTWLQIHFAKFTFNSPTLFQKPVPSKNRDENKEQNFFTIAFIWILFTIFSVDFIPSLSDKHLVVKLDTRFFLHKNQRGWRLCISHPFIRGHLSAVAWDLVELCEALCCPAWLGIRQLRPPLCILLD